MNGRDVKAKKLSIEAYFEEWQNRIDKAEKLLLDNKYGLEGLIVLLCYIGSFAYLRYGDKQGKDSKNYTKIVKEYSGFRDIYSKIDLLFFYQLRKTQAYKRNRKYYNKFNNYLHVRKIFIKEYGNNKDNIKSEKRYAIKKAILDLLIKKGVEEALISDVKNNIDKFSNAEILYKYFRCSAVHQGNFPLVNKRTSIEDGAVRYESNSAITIDLIIKTVKNIYSNLKQQCLKEVKWIHEL